MSGYIIRSFMGVNLPDMYRGMVYSRWLRSLRYGNDYFRLMEPKSYYRAYQAYISEILSRENCVVHVAVLNDDRDVALGFAVTHGSVLDFVHVQKDMRMQGIGSKLVPPTIDRITHLTKHGLAIWGRKRYSHLKFDPFA
jgi:GNAT superfamily N-acetyltransferase